MQTLGASNCIQTPYSIHVTQSPNLYDGMEETHSKDDLPPLPAEDMFLKERAADFSERPPHVGTETLRRLISNLPSH